MNRERVEKLLRMAHQSVSPREAQIARGMLEAAGEWRDTSPPPPPPRSEFTRTWQPTARPPVPTKDEAEELRRWREARAEFMAGNPRKFHEEMHRAFMEGFYEEFGPESASKTKFWARTAHKSEG